MTDDLTEIEIVYLGQREAEGNKLGLVIIARSKLDELIASGSGSAAIDKVSSLFTPKRGGDQPRTIGGIYRMGVKLDEGGRVITAATRSASWVGIGPYAELAGHWTAAERAVTMRKQAKAEEAKAAAANDLDRAIDVLARYYQRAGYANRSAFKLMVLDRLERGPKK
jgi:hypothetical protein